jgi:hypothetical protein
LLLVVVLEPLDQPVVVAVPHILAEVVALAVRLSNILLALRRVTLLQLPLVGRGRLRRLLLEHKLSQQFPQPLVAQEAQVLEEVAALVVAVI